MKLSEELQWRGFTNQTTYKNITELDGEPITFYLGVDPSAKSMQVGNLAIVMMVRHFIEAGHKAIVLVGGATGMIGDPDGKAEERELKTKQEVQENVDGIAAEYRRVLGDFDFTLVNNYEWFKDLNYLEFLRDVGKHVPMRQMLSRDFIKTRLGVDGTGISYAEFSYALVQGYDFVHLNRQHGATLQIAGSDQWGNSIAGVELIRRMEGKEAHVWTAPLVINKTTGKKFGKTEDGAVWLDPELTSVFKFYQFWLNSDDEGVEDYLKMYTMLAKNSIEQVMTDFKNEPYRRSAQKLLAYEVTKIVHGQASVDTVLKLTEVLFGKGNFEELSGTEKDLLKEELPTVEFSDNTAEMLVTLELSGSNSDANRAISAGAVSVNGQKLSEGAAFEVGLNLVKKGKNSFGIVIKN
jgi:tyrosyl-tRNA synthetase